MGSTDNFNLEIHIRKKEKMSIKIIKKSELSYPANIKRYCVCYKCKTFFSFENTDLRQSHHCDSMYLKYWIISCPHCDTIMLPLDFYWIRYLIMWFKYRKLMK